MARITSLNRHLIVFVDDEEKARKYFELIFRDTYQILCAGSAEAALALLDRHSANVAVLITDQQMPQERGLELIRTVKLRYPHIIRMLTTAHADLASAIDSVNSGEIFRYVLKPWDIDEFRQHINDALRVHREKQEEQQLLAEKRSSIFKVASNIAHELRTPLAGIYATVSGIQDDFAELVRAYPADGNAIDGLSSERQQALLRAFQNIERQVRHSQAMISILLENIRDPKALNATVIPSMQSCLEEALDTYPFFKQQRSLVQVDVVNDFAFSGNANAMLNVFHNLLKNALYALQASGKPGAGIGIRLDSLPHNNEVRFRDEGTGIPADVLPFIFDDFYSSKGQVPARLQFGNGIGLAYCKQALNSWSADIECQSVPGEFTEFTMRFPALE